MRPGDLKNQKVLFGCLNWGSGHIARSIPLLQDLSANGNELFIRCTEEQEFVFRKYSVSAFFLVHDGFQFRFKGDGNFTREMVRNGLRFAKWNRREHQIVERLVAKHQLSFVLSDHSYGLRSSNAHSIFITHQTKLPPKAGWLAQQIHQRWITRFDEIWIMDEAENRLAGILSDSVSNSSYIGWYSRFRNMETTTVPGKVVGIVSGPEPYAEQLFHWILKNYGQQELVLISSKSYTGLPNNIKLINDWEQADLEIASAETIVSRNGYSTLMDLKFLNKKSILIPTPGQLEQEYLANR
jgi:hypothetical protein